MSACEKALNHASTLKIDECEAVFVEKKIVTVRITDSQIAEVKENFEKNLGVRIIHQKKVSSAQTNNLDDITESVDNALKLIKFSEPKNYWKSLPYDLGNHAAVEKLFDKNLAEISAETAVDLSQEMINSTSKPQISRISGSLNIVSESIEIENSHGLGCSDRGTYISGTINADSEADGLVSGIGHGSCRTLDAFSAESVGNEAADMCLGSIKPQKCEEGTYSIIFDPYSVGELLAFVVANNFNLKAYAEKRSCFAEKLNSQIAVKEFNLIDDPHAPEGIGSKVFDDEGISTKQQSLVENGIFKNIYSDLFHSFKEGKNISGNACRLGLPMGRSSEPIPVPAPHNLKIMEGDQLRDEIIAETKKGLLVGRLWYTYAVNPTKGDFSCTARSGVRIIKNGEIKAPGKSVRIVHNLPTLFKNVSAIGNDSKNVLQWASLPSIAPTLKVEEIKVIPI
jgi:PmbA protein